jgi:rhamnogalacturonan endolyase
MSRNRCIAAIDPLERRLLFAFGVTATTSTLTVDNGGDLKFSVLKGGTLSSTIHLGDVTSIKYKGQEMLATYAQTSRYSHYEQGLGSIANISYTVDNTNNWILVTCDDSAETSGGVIQYYAVRKGDNNIYVASLPTDVNNGPGEGRFLAYLSKSVFTNIEEPSDISQNVGAVEGSDVFYNADGTTASKFYNMGRRMIENVYHGVTGAAGTTPVGAWMFMGNREHSAGGPFFKDIDFQTTSAATEIYNCLFTGHTQTESYRQGLQGPYALQFTDGSTPVAPDYSWMEQLNLNGWIVASARGTLIGTASGVPSGHEVTVGLSNSAAQYWGTPDATGNYTIAGIQPGTYTETLYDGELAVGTRTVTINTGAIAAANIVDTYYTHTPIWRIGTWDGTPLGFLNSDKIEVMHPSDVRMTPWTNVNYVVGTNTAADWPLVQFKAPPTDPTKNPNNLQPLNPTERVTFNLTSSQAATAMTLRIGITLAFAGGRPIISVNGGSYTAAPAISTQPDSRGITRGTWRGNNWLYTYNISTSQLRTGANTIDVGIASGSYDLYSSYLQPSITYDAIDLVPTSSLTNAPRVSSMLVTPTNPNVPQGGQQTFLATAKDQFGNATPANVSWSAARGLIDGAGGYTAPAATGSDTITAAVGSVSGSTPVNVTSLGPVHVTAASFDYQTGQSVALTFNRDVGASLTSDDLQIRNLADNSLLAAGSLQLTYTPSTARFTIVSNALPDGNYRAMLPTGSVSDAFSNTLASDYTFDFFVLRGDANHDRSVDLTDFTILASNFNKTGRTFGQGDFSYDGNVDLTDFAMLAANFNRVLSPASVPIVALSAVSSPPLTPKVHTADQSLWSQLEIV